MAKRKMSTFERLRNGRMNRQERKEWQRRLYAEDAGLEVVHPHAAGIDVGNASHFVAVPADRDEQPVREVGSWTADLRRMSRMAQAVWHPHRRDAVHRAGLVSPAPSVGA